MMMLPIRYVQYHTQYCMHIILYVQAGYLLMLHLQYATALRYECNIFYTAHTHRYTGMPACKSFQFSDYLYVIDSHYLTELTILLH